MPVVTVHHHYKHRLGFPGHLGHFDFAKITCSRSIDGATGLSGFCKGKTPKRSRSGFWFVSTGIKVLKPMRAQLSCIWN